MTWEAWKPLKDDVEYLISQEVNFPQHALSSRLNFLEEEKIISDQRGQLNAVTGRILLYLLYLILQLRSKGIIKRLTTQYQPQWAYKAQFRTWESPTEQQINYCFPTINLAHMRRIYNNLFASNERVCCFLRVPLADTSAHPGSEFMAADDMVPLKPFTCLPEARLWWRTEGAAEHNLN